MNKTLKFIALLSTMLLFAACGEESQSASDPFNSREIVYTLNSKVMRTTLTTDKEWDALLDRFCDYTHDGQTISFYNSQRVAQHSKSLPAPKEATTISTTSREEMKEWMKAMEQAGKTVTVIYDEGSGTWNGTAYANGAQTPEAAENNMIVGKWHYYTMTSVSLEFEGDSLFLEYQTVTPESMGNTIYYEFRSDGTMTYSRGTAGGNGTAQTREGTWTLSEEGELCCEHFDGASCWIVGCAVNGIMVLYRTANQPFTNDLVYQMELHAVR